MIRGARRFRQSPDDFCELLGTDLLSTDLLGTDLLWPHHPGPTPRPRHPGPTQI